MSDPPRTVSPVQIVWIMVGAMGAVIMILATGLWTYQQGQVTAVAAMAASDANRITALEVQVKQLQDNYSGINTKLDQIATRQISNGGVK